MTTIAELNVGDVVRLEGGRWPDHRANGTTTIITGFEHRNGIRHRALVSTDLANHVNDGSYPFVLVERAADANGVDPDQRLLDFIQPLLTAGGADFTSFANLTGRASTTRGAESAASWKEWASIRAGLADGSILAWAVERGFEVPTEQAPVAEKTLEEALAAGEYHPTLLPLMERLSKVACDAGYCSTYDSLAREAGVPTRDEVKALVRERDGGQYRVRYTLPVHIDIVVSADDEAAAERQAREATSMWGDIVTILEARIAELRAGDRLYQLGAWSGDAEVTAIDE